jgi:hypothetical protein
MAKALVATLLGLGLSACASAARTPIVLSVENASRQPPLIVDQPIVVSVSLRGNLPPGPLRWSLLLEGRYKAGGGIERLDGDVPRREFTISTVVDHKDYAAAGGLPAIPRRSGPSSPVRDVRFELVVKAEGERTVATAQLAAKATCAANDTDPSCW